MNEESVLLVCITVVEFIETTTFSVAVISTSGSMSATLITFGTAPYSSRPTNNFAAMNYQSHCANCLSV